MTIPERRREERRPIDLPGELFLSHGRCIPVRIVNLGRLGALISVADLEEAVLEGERVVLGHPVLQEDGSLQEEGGEGGSDVTRTPASVVRVELEFSDDGVARHLAVYFDGGATPDGYSG